MNKLIISGFFCLFSVLAQAEVQLEIDASQVSLEEPFHLVLTQNNLQTGSGIPDLGPLRNDFFILGTERSVNYAIINGQTQSSSTWTITLKAQKTGTLTIPPIKIGNEQTTPLSITVTGAAAKTATQTPPGQQQGIMLTTEVNEKKPYINQQITYKVSLYNSKQLLDANYQGPKVDNALLVPLGNEKRYQTQKNNVPYLVEEQSYAIFPQKSGPLKITSPVFNALVYNFEPQRVKVEDKAITLDVQPIPKQYTGKEWLPAKQVKLTEEYENISQTLSEGSTLVRTVRLEGVGIPAQLLPTLNFTETKAFNVYPEKGQEKNQIVQGELLSSTEIKVTYLLNKSGKITIPELRLPWFNTTTAKEEVATLAPRNIEVTAASTTPSPPKAKHATATPDVVAENTSTAAPRANNWPWLIAGLFALAWLLTLGLWGWQKRNHTRGKGAYKKAMHQLHTACNQGNPQRARDALLTWAGLHWPDAPILNLMDLTRLVGDASLKKQVQILSQVLYQDAEKNLWRGDELWRSVQNLKQTTYPTKNKTAILPPINPA